MTIKGYIRLIAILLIVGLWGLTDAVCPKVADANDFFDDFESSALSGYVIDGRAKAFLESITIYEPKDEKLFGIPFKFARYKVNSFDGKDMVDDLWMVGKIGDSDTFYLAYRKLDEPFDMNAGGVLYNASQHWDKDLPPILLGVYIMEGSLRDVPSKKNHRDGKPAPGSQIIQISTGASILYTLYGEYEIAVGYFIGADILLGMETWCNPDFREFEFWGKHNFKPDGSTFGKIFVINASGYTYVGGGVGFTFN